MKSKFVFALTYLALEIIAGGAWPGDAYAASIDQQAEVTADRLAGLIKSGGKRTEIEALHTHLRKLIQRLPREKSSIAAAYKVRAQALWQLYKPSLARVTDACAKCPALNLTALVPEYARPRLLGAGDYTLLDLKEMGKQGYTTLVTGDFNRDGRDDVALVGKNEQDTGSELFFLIVGVDNKGGYRRLLFEKPDWDKAALAGYKGKLTLTENFYPSDDLWEVSWNGKQFVFRYAGEHP